MYTYGEAHKHIKKIISSKKRIIHFISNKSLINCIGVFYNSAFEKINLDQSPWKSAEFYKRGVDPFCTVAGMLNAGHGSMAKYFREIELVRQRDKKISSAIGKFHQNILCSTAGSLKPKSGLDFIHHKKGIVAEIKNKHNTTKGDDLVQPYDKLAAACKSPYKGYTGYFVNILPEPKKRGYAPINRNFTPSVPGKGKSLRRNNVKIIDGMSFYALITDDANALRKIYEKFPFLLAYFIYENADSTKKRLIKNIKVLKSKPSYSSYLFDHIFTKLSDPP